MRSRIGLNALPATGSGSTGLLQARTALAMQRKRMFSTFSLVASAMASFVWITVTWLGMIASPCVPVAMQRKTLPVVSLASSQSFVAGPCTTSPRTAVGPATAKPMRIVGTDKPATVVTVCSLASWESQETSQIMRILGSKKMKVTSTRSHQIVSCSSRLLSRLNASAARVMAKGVVQTIEVCAPPACKSALRGEHRTRAFAAHTIR
mmetsp:Transcript_5993/g.13895  ORF Transcript_5993/g.13895 Transcript_5993/m.13895 type:complete len:207 (-) Transcript_5993:384-1004(-)